MIQWSRALRVTYNLPTTTYPHLSWSERPSRLPLLVWKAGTDETARSKWPRLTQDIKALS